MFKNNISKLFCLIRCWLSNLSSMDLFPYLYKKIIKCDLIESPISSTTIREKIANNEDTTGLLEPNVALYIKENSLYKNI